MHPLLALALFLVVVLIGLYIFISVKPATLVRAIRTFTTTFAALAGTGLLLSGRFGLALVTFIAAVAALRALRGSVAGGNWNGGAGGSATSGQASEIQTDTLAMRLDHRSGDLDGEVLRGPFAGRQLETLGLQDLLSLLVDCQQEDPRSVSLMETYLDRRHPEWRSHANDDRHAGSGAHEGRAPNSRMDVATACQILDVAPNAAADEIKAAHRRLMNKLHPDHGGSSFLAAQLNEAKDVLLNR